MFEKNRATPVFEFVKIANWATLWVRVKVSYETLSWWDTWWFVFNTCSDSRCVSGAWTDYCCCALTGALLPLWHVENCLKKEGLCVLLPISSNRQANMYVC